MSDGIMASRQEETPGAYLEEGKPFLRKEGGNCRRDVK